MDRIKNINKFEAEFKKLYNRVDAEIATADERNLFAEMHYEYIKRFDYLEMSLDCKEFLYNNPIVL